MASDGAFNYNEIAATVVADLLKWGLTLLGSRLSSGVVTRVAFGGSPRYIHFSRPAIDFLGRLVDHDVDRMTVTSTVELHQLFTPASIQYFAVQAERNRALGGGKISRILLTEWDLVDIKNVARRKHDANCGRAVLQLHDILDIRLAHVPRSRLQKVIPPDDLSQVGVADIKKDWGKLDFGLLTKADGSHLLLLPVFAKKGPMDIAVLTESPADRDKCKSIAASAKAGCDVESDPTLVRHYAAIESRLVQAETPFQIDD